MDDLKVYLLQKIKEYEERHPEEVEYFRRNNSLSSASFMPRSGRTIDAIEEQIHFQAQRMGIDPKKFLEDLLSRPGNNLLIQILTSILP